MLCADNFFLKTREAYFLSPTWTCFYKLEPWWPSPALLPCYANLFLADSRRQRVRKREREWKEIRSLQDVEHCSLSPTSSQGKGLMSRCLTWVSNLANKTPAASKEVVAPDWTWMSMARRVSGQSGATVRIKMYRPTVQLIQNSNHGASSHPTLQAAAHAATLTACSSFQAAGTRRCRNTEAETAETHAAFVQQFAAFQHQLMRWLLIGWKFAELGVAHMCLENST